MAAGFVFLGMGRLARLEGPQKQGLCFVCLKDSHRQGDCKTRPKIRDFDGCH